MKTGKSRHLRIEGSPDFKIMVRRALKLVKAVGYYDFLKTYIHYIKEIDGLTQLRVSESTIWANKYAVENPVDAASRFIQEAYYMRMHLEKEHTELYHEGLLELKSFEERIKFLKRLREKSRKLEVKSECDKLLRMWKESLLIY